MKRCSAFLLIELAFALSFVYSDNIYGQIWPKLSWYKTYNGPCSGIDIVRDVKFHNGNLYLVGISAGADTIPDIQVLEYSDKGDSLLGIRYSANNRSTEDVASIAIDFSDNIYIAGSSSFDWSTFYTILLKYSPAGNLIFAKYFNRDSNIISDGNFVVLDSNEDPILGYTQWYNGQSAKVVKYSASGDSIWTAVFADDTSRYLLKYLLTDQDDNIYAALQQIYPNSSDVPAVKTVVAKINKMGGIIWQTPVEGNAPRKIILDKDQNIILITQGKGRTIKINPDGNIQWGNDYNNSKYPISVITGLAIDYNNNIIVSGYEYINSSWDYRTKKLSPGGEEIWSKDFDSIEGLNDFAMDVAVDSSNNIYVTGESNDQVSVGMCYTVTYSENGEPGWIYEFDPPNSTFETPIRLFIGDSNYIYIGGYTSEPHLGPDFLAFKIGYGKGNDVKQLDNKIPGSFSLNQNYPNPFNPTTKIGFRIANSGFVTLKVYNVLGKEIAALVNEEKPAGTYEVRWNASNLSSGVYFYKLTSGSFMQVKKSVLLK